MTRNVAYKIFIQQTAARFAFISTHFAVFLYLLANFSSLASVYLTKLNSLVKPLNRVLREKGSLSGENTRSNLDEILSL